MSDSGRIEIKVSGQIGNQPLSPDNFDIREIKGLFDVMEDLLYPNQKFNRSTISYSIESGSVKNIFKTSVQAATAFIAVASMIQQSGSLDGLELPTAKAIQEIQKAANRNGFIYQFGIPGNEHPSLTISNESSFHINESLWADAEFYFYGIIVDAGGKDKTNIHLQTKDNGVISIETEKEFLQDREDNVLYKHFKVRASGRQNIVTGAIDFSRLHLLELTKFDPKYNEEYLSRLIKKASATWKDVHDADAWIYQIRGING